MSEQINLSKYLGKSVICAQMWDSRLCNLTVCNVYVWVFVYVCLCTCMFECLCMCVGF